MAIRGQWGLGYEHLCSYLADQAARMEMMVVETLDEMDLDALLAQGYRHFGKQFFRPFCRDCHACIPIRVPTDRFRLRRSGHRALARGAHLQAEVCRPQPSLEAYELYCRHKERFRDTNPDADPVDYATFTASFFEPFPFAFTLNLRDGPRLVAVAHFDLTRHSLSAVYCYWEPADSACNPGRVAVLRQIALAAERGISQVYLGFYIAANPHMSYKADLFPNEILLSTGCWVPFMDASGRRCLTEASLGEGFRSPGRPFLRRPVGGRAGAD